MDDNKNALMQLSTMPSDSLEIRISVNGCDLALKFAVEPLDNDPLNLALQNLKEDYIGKSIMR